MRLAFFPLLLSGCTFVVATDVDKGGIGAPCQSSDDCHASTCEQGLCTSPCAADVDCPEGSLCSNGSCQTPLSAAFLYVGVPGDEGWTQTHEEGRQYAEAALPWLDTQIVTNVIPVLQGEDAVLAQIDELVGGGVQVVVANSFDHQAVMQAAAEAHPDVEFLTCSASVTGENLGSYFGRSYQAWYLAGFAAAKTSQTHRLGFLGSFVTPEVVRHINAFTRGARRADPTVLVEVRWEGFWFDTDGALSALGTPDERVLTEQMIASGCDVIAHNSDLGVSVAVVDEHAANGEPVWSIGNDNPDACDRGPTSCLGVPAWNWGPLYASILDRIHKQTWDPTALINEQVKVDPSESIVSFLVNDAVVDVTLKSAVGGILTELAAPGGDAVPFAGPYCSTGQRPTCLGEAEVVLDVELATMCWFVDGIVERSDPLDPLSADQPALVPDGTIEVPRGGDPAKVTFPDCKLTF